MKYIKPLSKVLQNKYPLKGLDKETQEELKELFTYIRLLRNNYHKILFINELEGTENFKERFLKDTEAMKLAFKLEQELLKSV